MKNIKLNKRQLQAQQTKLNIFEAAKSLFQEYGINNVYVNDIVKAAGVSTGTFYLYFASKDQIVAEIYLNEDDFFDNLKASLKSNNPIERIKEFFSMASQHIEEKNGLEIVKQLYLPTNTSINERMPYNATILNELIITAQEHNLLTKEETAQTIASFLLTLTSGLIFEWCLNDGSFSLHQRTCEYVCYALKSFK